MSVRSRSRGIHRFYTNKAVSRPDGCPDAGSNPASHTIASSGSYSEDALAGSKIVLVIVLTSKRERRLPTKPIKRR